MASNSTLIAARNLTTPGLRLTQTAMRLALHERTPAVTHRPHDFTPHREDQNVATQCRICWGWIDDYRHVGRAS